MLSPGDPICFSRSFVSLLTETRNVRRLVWQGRDSCPVLQGQGKDVFREDREGERERVGYKKRMEEREREGESGGGVKKREGGR